VPHINAQQAIEICQLRIEDIDSARMQIHIERSKGEQQRRTVLSRMGLTLLRAYWVTCKVKGPLLFPENVSGRALTREAFNKALGIATTKAKVNKRVTPHGLRHYVPFRTMSGNERVFIDVFGIAGQFENGSFDYPT